MQQKVIITMFETTQYIAIVEEKDFQRQLYNCEINDINFISIHDMKLDLDAKLNPKYIASIIYEEVKKWTTCQK